MFASNLSHRKLLAAVLATAALIAASGCGRRGDLEPPSANAVQNSTGKHDLGTHRQEQVIKAPKKDFVLDPLLQ